MLRSPDAHLVFLPKPYKARGGWDAAAPTLEPALLPSGPHPLPPYTPSWASPWKGGDCRTGRHVADCVSGDLSSLPFKGHRVCEPGDLSRPMA